jgi:cell division FtsZ-interacting protein ZapD
VLQWKKQGNSCTVICKEAYKPTQDTWKSMQEDTFLVLVRSQVGTESEIPGGTVGFLRPAEYCWGR